MPTPQRLQQRRPVEHRRRPPRAGRGACGDSRGRRRVTKIGTATIMRQVSVVSGVDALGHGELDDDALGGEQGGAEQGEEYPERLRVWRGRRKRSGPGKSSGSMFAPPQITGRPRLKAGPVAGSDAAHTGPEGAGNKFANDDPSAWAHTLGHVERCDTASGTPPGWRRHRARYGKSRSAARMGGAVGVEQAVGVDGGVDLRRRQRGVAEQFLDGAEVAAAAEQMGGEGVAQRVRRGRGRQAEGAAQLRDARAGSAAATARRPSRRGTAAGVGVSVNGQSAR